MIELMSVSEATQEWLEKASKNLGTARYLFDAGRWEDTAFYTQQCAEKAIKGLLTFHDIPFPKTHYLKELRPLIEPVDAAFAVLVTEANDLSTYAWEFRYPGATKEANQELALNAIAIAQKVYSAVLERVPEDAWPRNQDPKT